ncbi:hypothetical protein D3C84_1053400 [compost metagenome]
MRDPIVLTAGRVKVFRGLPVHLGEPLIELPHRVDSEHADARGWNIFKGYAVLGFKREKHPINVVTAFNDISRRNGLGNDQLVVLAPRQP